MNPTHIRVFQAVLRQLSGLSLETTANALLAENPRAILISNVNNKISQGYRYRGCIPYGVNHLKSNVCDTNTDLSSVEVDGALTALQNTGRIDKVGRGSGRMLVVFDRPGENTTVPDLNTTANALGITAAPLYTTTATTTGYTITTRPTANDFVNMLRREAVAIVDNPEPAEEVEVPVESEHHSVNENSSIEELQTELRRVTDLIIKKTAKVADDNLLLQQATWQ